MTAKSPRDNISRALKSIDRAWEAVRSALKAGQMTKTAERAIAVAQKSLSVKADAEIYRDTGKIVALDDSDLLWCDEEDVVTLNVDAYTFSRVMYEAADMLESQARSWDAEADELATDANGVDDRIGELQEEHGFLCETAQDGERYLDIVPRDEAIVAQLRDLDEVHESLAFAESASTELWAEENDKRSGADGARSEVARKRRSAEEVQAAAQAQRLLMALREVESEARRKADAAIAKARNRVMAEILADDDPSLSNDRTTELLARFADLIGSSEVQITRTRGSEAHQHPRIGPVDPLPHGDMTERPL